MIQPIFIDTLSLTRQFDITKEEVDGIIDAAVKKITMEFYLLWEKEAEKNLHKTRKAYVSQLKLVDEGRMKGAVLLDYTKNPLVKMLEEGANAFDMKEGFKKSSKVKYRSNGDWYLTIPFRMATPDALGESTLFAGKMPQSIYDIVKEKPQDIDVQGGGKRSKGLTNEEMKNFEVPAKYRLPKTRAGVSVVETQKTFDEYKNKSSIYEGLSKIQDNVTGQNIYMNFRRVSSNSDINSWVHTGLMARNFAEKALSNLESKIEIIVGDTIDNALQELGFE